MQSNKVIDTPGLVGFRVFLTNYVSGKDQMDL